MNYNLTRRTCSLLLTLLCSASSHAADPTYYLGGAIGGTELRFRSVDFRVQGTVPAVSKDTTNTGFKLYAGYRFGQHIAAELAYTDFGRFRYDMRATTGAVYSDFTHRFRYQTRSWSISLKGNWPISSDWSVFGRLGATWNRATNTYAVEDVGHVEPPLPPGYVAPPLSDSRVYATPGRHSHDRVAPLLGIGIEYGISEHARLRLEYEDYGRFGTPATTGRARLSLTSVALEYSF